jgi:hypothetical protein
MAFSFSDKLLAASSKLTAMSMADLPNLWVPLTLLATIAIAAIFFSRSSR